MGLLDSLFKRPNREENIRGYFKMLNGYQPVFYNYEGGIYEQEITRSAIHAFATHCSKLEPEIEGSAYKTLGNRVKFKMNPWMDTSKFLYRLATILAVDNNAFIVPIMDELGQSIQGYYPIRPTQTELMQDINGRPWLRYTFANGQKASIEFDRVGVMNQYQYKDDLFGESNSVLYPTMQLINTHNQGIVEGVKQSATIRFMARLANVYKAEDIAKERTRFTQENLSYENNSGVLMFDNKYADVKQIDSKPFVVDADQLVSIKSNVFSYFGCNEKILQNSFSEDDWNAYYEGKIEPFAIQLSLVLSNMTFTEREIAQGNKIIFTANRLQYASNKTKLEVVTQLFDRGFLTHNQGREIFNMSEVPDGNKYFIRLEYGNKDEDKAKTKDAGTTGEIAKVSLNGAQITSLLEIVSSVATGLLSYDSAVKLITSAFPFDEVTAKAILGNPETLKKFIVEEKPKENIDGGEE